MRRLALPLAAVLVLAACSGDSGGNAVTLPDTTTTELPVQTVATTEALPATEVATTEATTSTSTSTTTIEDIPLTVLEPATTVIPADIDETFAEAFAVYQEAWTVRQQAAQDPDGAEVREAIDRYYIDPARAELIGNLDEQASGSIRGSIDPSREPSRVSFVEAVATVENGTFVEFKTCEVVTTLALDTETDEVVFDTILAYSGEVRMLKDDAQWFVREEVLTSFVEGTECES